MDLCHNCIYRGACVNGVPFLLARKTIMEERNKFFQDAFPAALEKINIAGKAIDLGKCYSLGDLINWERRLSGREECFKLNMEAL